MASVFDFAAQICKRLGWGIDNFRLNKLVYYVQAWSLVHRDRPAFSESIHAWVNGPVAKDLWVDMRHHSSRALYGAAATELSADDAEIVEQVLLHYGAMSAEDLVKLTHDELPWRLARGTASPTEKTDEKISLDEMRSYYAAVWQEAKEHNEAAARPPAFVGTVSQFAAFILG